MPNKKVSTKSDKRDNASFRENPFAYAGISASISIISLLCEIISRQDKCRVNGFPEGYCTSSGLSFILLRLTQFVAVAVALSFSIIAMVKTKKHHTYRSLSFCCAILSFLLVVAAFVFIFWEVFEFLNVLSH